jgi:catechol 2,3-dioxygenase-like lactoylglutathione lyase family enzyme
VSAISNLVEVVLVVDDIEKSMAFYNGALGLDVISPPELAAKFLRIGPARAGIPQQLVLVPRSPALGPAPGSPRPRILHHIGLEVAPADYDPLRQRLSEAGFTLRTGEHPFMPVDAFYVDDPDGNEVELATWRH